MKRGILGCYWDAERAAKMKVLPNAPTIILFLAPKIVGHMVWQGKLNLDAVRQMRDHFVGWQVAVDQWHGKQPQEIREQLTRHVPLTPQAMVALDPHSQVLGAFVSKNTLFTGTIPLMNDTGEVLEAVLLITEHAGISVLDEPAPDFHSLPFASHIYEGKSSALHQAMRVAATARKH